MMKNTGFEFDLSFNAVQTKEFDYNFNVIGTTMSNKFVDFSNSEYVGQDYYSVCGTEDPYPFYNLQRIEKGESVGNFFMWRYAGINEDGEWLVYDKDGDIINAARIRSRPSESGQTVCRSSPFDHHNFRYRNFDLSLLPRCLRIRLYSISMISTTAHANSPAMCSRRLTVRISPSALHRRMQ